MIFKPDYNTASLFDIPFNELKQQGIKMLLFDLDSTVMPSKSGIFPEAVLQLFEILKKDFQLAIISNNSKEDYLQKARSQTSVPIIGSAEKPCPKVILDFLKSKGINSSNAVMIGDRPLTDIWAGKAAGTKTVLTDSITKDSENKITRFARKLERLFIRTF